MKKCQIFLSVGAALAVLLCFSGCGENHGEISPDSGLSERLSEIPESTGIFEGSKAVESSSAPENPAVCEECVHEYIISDSRPPACESGGEIVYSCVKCGESFSEEIPAENHKYVEKITLEATDFSPGIKTYCCSECGKSYRENYSLGHSVNLGDGKTAVIYGYWDLRAALEIFELLNEYRRANNLSELEQNEELSETARLRALECAWFYSHTRPDGNRCFTAFPEGYALAAENVGAGFGGSAQRVMMAWINSPAHNENLLNPEFNFAGTSLFVMTGNDSQNHGGTYFSQEFICG